MARQDMQARVRSLLTAGPATTPELTAAVGPVIPSARKQVYDALQVLARLGRVRRAGSKVADRRGSRGCAGRPAVLWELVAN